MTIDIKNLTQLQQYFRDNEKDAKAYSPSYNQGEKWEQTPVTWYEDYDEEDQDDETEIEIVDFNEIISEEYKIVVGDLELIPVDQARNDEDYHWVFDLTNTKTGDTVQVGWSGSYDSWNGTELDDSFDGVMYIKTMPTVYYVTSDKPQ